MKKIGKKIPDVEETTEIPETEPIEPTEGDNETPVIETKNHSAGDTGNSGTGSGDASATEPVGADYGISLMTLGDAEIDSMVTAENIKVIETQAITGEDGKTTYENLSDATILYEDNCVENGLVKANGTKIAFTVVPNKGKKVTAVKYFTAESEDKFTGSGTSAAVTNGNTGDLGAVYSISTSIPTLEKNKQVVRIAVTVADVEYTVNFTDNAGGAKAWKKDAAGKYVLSGADTEITGGTTVTYGETLTFAVTNLAKAAKTNVTANAGRTDLTLNGTDGTVDSTPYVEFTLDPANLEGITSNADDTITVTLENADDIDIEASNGGMPNSVTIDPNVTVTTPTLKDTYTTTYKALATTAAKATYSYHQSEYDERYSGRHLCDDCPCGMA